MCRERELPAWSRKLSHLQNISWVTFRESLRWDKAWVFVLPTLTWHWNFSFSNNVGIQNCTVTLNNNENDSIHILCQAQPRCQVDLGCRVGVVLPVQCWVAPQQPFPTPSLQPPTLQAEQMRFPAPFPAFSAVRDRHLTQCWSKDIRGKLLKIFFLLDYRKGTKRERFLSLPPSHTFSLFLSLCLAPLPHSTPLNAVT